MPKVLAVGIAGCDQGNPTQDSPFENPYEAIGQAHNNGLDFALERIKKGEFVGKELRSSTQTVARKLALKYAEKREWELKKSQQVVQRALPEPADDSTVGNSNTIVSFRQKVRSSLDSEVARYVEKIEESFATASSAD